MKSIILFGNGFNKLLANLVNNYPTEKIPKALGTDLKTISNNINDIAGLWERFKYAFPKIKQSHPYLCDEQILCLLNDLANEELFKEVIPTDKIEELTGKVNIARKNSLKEVATDFKRFENISGNKVIRRLFPHFGVGFENMLNNNEVEEAFICTTNYDGILDTLLTGPIKNNGTSFIYPDCFGLSNIEGHLKLNESRLKIVKRCMVHLHGSYKFTKYKNNTYKITGDIFNEEPVLIFNNPFLKEQEILNDQVLSAYYKTLTERLKSYDRLVIIGNSFRYEPHIKELISKHFDRSRTELVVCSLNPEEVAKELQEHYRKEIYQFSTKDVWCEKQLLHLLNQLFAPNIMNSNMCINSTGLVA
ncbi:hypothetical protein [Pontibacter oryzae]|uniref:SIR2-like domain-containing protein n=1 Tax=Pontibacter oryzae TaxID=2304593 RepID=A0A399S6W9_9BACT|nr:hypothetical protein [Pontibacter oryzae]RIJ37557.1 hypothetical protein D1627_10625 [Pontibacter oryzae]